MVHAYNYYVNMQYCIGHIMYTLLIAITYR